MWKQLCKRFCTRYTWLKRRPKLYSRAQRLQFLIIFDQYLRSIAPPSQSVSAPSRSKISVGSALFSSIKFSNLHGNWSHSSSNLGGIQNMPGRSCAFYKPSVRLSSLMGTSYSVHRKYSWKLLWSRTEDLAVLRPKSGPFVRNLYQALAETGAA